jgi:hypothetical protein
LGLSLIVYVIGAATLLAGAVAIAAASARGGRVTSVPPLADLPVAHRRPLLLAAGVVLAGGGLALCAFPRWAPPIFILGMLGATAGVLYGSRIAPPLDQVEARSRRRLLTAIYLYAAITALVLWLESQGVLS